MKSIAACHKVFTENNGLEVNISVTIKRRKMINPRTLSQAAAHKRNFRRSKWGDYLSRWYRDVRLTLHVVSFAYARLEEILFFSEAKWAKRERFWRGTSKTDAIKIAPPLAKNSRNRLIFLRKNAKMRGFAQIVSDRVISAIFLLHPVPDLPRMRVTWCRLSSVGRATDL